MFSASVTTRPRKPRSRRSSPVTTFRDRVAGVPGSTAWTAMWATITDETPPSTPAAKGTRSLLRSWRSDLSWTGISRWLSAGTDPWPGKCLITGRMPDER